MKIPKIGSIVSKVEARYHEVSVCCQKDGKK